VATSRVTELSLHKTVSQSSVLLVLGWHEIHEASAFDFDCMIIIIIIIIGVMGLTCLIKLVKFFLYLIFAVFITLHLY